MIIPVPLDYVTSNRGDSPTPKLSNLSLAAVSTSDIAGSVCSLHQTSYKHERPKNSPVRKEGTQQGRVLISCCSVLMTP